MYVCWPIKHREYFLGIKKVAGAVRTAWEDGMAVVFHCNCGKVRGPCAAAVFLGHVSGPAYDAIDWLTTVGLQGTADECLH